MGPNVFCTKSLVNSFLAVEKDSFELVSFMLLEPQLGCVERPSQFGIDRRDKSDWLFPHLRMVCAIDLPGLGYLAPLVLWWGSVAIATNSRLGHHPVASLSIVDSCQSTTRRQIRALDVFSHRIWYR